MSATRWKLASAFALIAVLATPARADAFLWELLMYVPNRALDVLDVVRVRVRVGPGFAAGARATEVAELYLGAYTSIYAGLPGPRGRQMPRLPVGIESRAGAAAGPADMSTGGGTAPEYGPAEIGLGFQAALVGIDIGIEPLEALDFAAGLIFIDLRDDDF